MSEIYIYDEYSPETMAMLQALYSRSSKSVQEHILKINQEKSKAMLFNRAKKHDFSPKLSFVVLFSKINSMAVSSLVLVESQLLSMRSQWLFLNIYSILIIFPSSLQTVVSTTGNAFELTLLQFLIMFSFCFVTKDSSESSF